MPLLSTWHLNANQKLYRYLKVQRHVLYLIVRWHNCKSKMENFEWLNLLYYCLFGTFVYYQQIHVKNFRGASKVFEMVLTISAFLGMIVGLGYLIYYGYLVVWWAPFLILVIGILFQFVAGFIERLLGQFTMSLLGFVAWPLFAYLMFQTIPT